MGWRDKYRVHPAAELFPEMVNDALADLGEDIKENGLQEPVVFYLDRPTWGGNFKDEGQALWLLDGRNRLTAMELAGVPTFNQSGEPIGQLLFRVLSNDTDPYTAVTSLNVHRRHLTAQQRRDLIAQLLKLGPGRSDRQIAADVRVDHKTVGKIRKQSEATGEIPHSDVRQGADGRKTKVSTAPKLKAVPDAPASKEEHERGPTTEDEPPAPSPPATIPPPAPAPPLLDRRVPCGGQRISFRRWLSSISSLDSEMIDEAGKRLDKAWLKHSRNPRSGRLSQRMRAIRAEQKKGSFIELLELQYLMVRLTSHIESFKVEDYQLDEVGQDFVKRLFDDFTELDWWIERTNAAIMARLNDAAVVEKIRKLREDHQGRTDPEIQISLRLADKLQRKLDEKRTVV